jgi:hypothetical protein
MTDDAIDMVVRGRPIHLRRSDVLRAAKERHFLGSSTLSSPRLTSMYALLCSTSTTRSRSRRFVLFDPHRERSNS